MPLQLEALSLAAGRFASLSTWGRVLGGDKDCHRSAVRVLAEVRRSLVAAVPRLKAYGRLTSPLPTVTIVLVACGSHSLVAVRASTSFWGIGLASRLAMNCSSSTPLIGHGVSHRGRVFEPAQRRGRGQFLVAPHRRLNRQVMAQHVVVGHAFPAAAKPVHALRRRTEQLPQLRTRAKEGSCQPRSQPKGNLSTRNRSTSASPLSQRARTVSWLAFQALHHCVKAVVIGLRPRWH